MAGFGISNSEGHVRRLVKRLWRQGHITEEIRESQIQGARGGITRKKVYMYPESNDQVLFGQSQQGFEALDHNPPQNDQVLFGQSQQGFEALDHSLSLTREVPQLQIGDCVEIQTGCFASHKVEIVGFPIDQARLG